MFAAPGQRVAAVGRRPPRSEAQAREEGRRAGTFDIVTFELQLAEAGSEDGGWQARTSFVFPRRS
ncbi:MAG TPA: hypothetical protein VMV92_30195 [Streptosporangiaceae bacterium]|nr:hypothetical protein [Streptosporangiaceae bacterium]